MNTPQKLIWEAAGSPPQKWQVEKVTGCWRDMVIDGVRYRWVHGRLLKEWTDAAIARHVGRTEYAVRKYRQRLHQHSFNQELLATSDACRITGLTAHQLTYRARRGEVKARKKPGSWRWLFYADSLPCSG